MDYRKEIDGLRAIAVIPVILFHAGFATFSGGFVGVDIFFVISGYLITGLIIKELKEGDFRLAEFYERRARRILPALFLVVLCSVLFAWQWMLPTDFKDFIESLIATATFSSNFYFWSETGYFAGPSSAKPLLHTWSLAIEEQFYLLFPLLLMTIWNLGKHATATFLSIIAIISFSGSVWMTYNHPDAAFYLLPTRAWELLIGSLCALYLARQKHAVPLPIGNGLSALGLLLITTSVFLFDENWAFPGFFAAVPTLGAALVVLFGNSNTVANHFLRAGILPKIGLISYSAYLWHHPIFAFLRLRTLNEPGAAAYAIAILASFALAYLTWKFIETPFRDRRSPLPFLTNSRQVLFVSSGFAVSIAAFGLLILATDARSEKKLVSDLGVLTMSDLERQLAPNRGLSDLCNGAISLTSQNCRTSDTPEILVWGDSFAMHVVDAVHAANPDAGLIQLTQSVCIPTLGVSFFNRASAHNIRWARSCIEFNESVLSVIKDTPSIKAVVISSPFDALLNEADLLLNDGSTTDNSDRKLARAFVETLEVIEALGKYVVVASPPPRDGRDLGKCVAKRVLFGADLQDCKFAPEDFTSAHVQITDFLRSLESRFQVIWLENLICAADICTPYQENGLIYRDGGHLSHWGSRMIGQTHATVFQLPPGH